MGEWKQLLGLSCIFAISLNATHYLNKSKVCND